MKHAILLLLLAAVGNKAVQEIQTIRKCKKSADCTVVGESEGETISACVKDNKDKEGHTCLILPGRYAEKIPMMGAESITISGVFGKEKPVIDGTVVLAPKDDDGKETAWTKIQVVDDKDTATTEDDETYLACSGKIDINEYKEAFGFADDDEIHPFQLFFKSDKEYKLMINARWPNAGWTDRMDPPKWSEHEHLTKKFAKEGVPKVFYNDFWRKWTQQEEKTKNVRGAFIDGNRNVEGCEKGRDCGSLLKDKNIDLTGAMVVLGINWWDNYHRRITKHEAGNDTFEYNVFAEYPLNSKKPHEIKPHKDGTKGHQYYVDSLEPLMDTPWEWFYDKTTRYLSFVPPKGIKSCSEIEKSAIRGRVIDYAMEIESTTDLKIKNLEFFATTIYAEGGESESNDIDKITLDSIDFLYPGTNRRMLKEDSDPIATTIMSSSNTKGNILVENCKFMGSDSTAFRYRGENVVIKNNEFKFNDWSGISGDKQKSNKATLQSICSNKVDGTKIYFKGEKIIQNTFLYGGSTQAMNPCRNATVSGNLIVGSRHGNLKQDGASINTGGDDLEHLLIEKNWVFDSTMLAIRVDGGGPGKEAGEQGQPEKESCKLKKYVDLSKNVVWKCDGYNIKGDYHKVDGNLALDMKQEDNDVLEPDDDEECEICRGMNGMKMPFVRKNGCITNENGESIPCIQNDNSELTNNAFMFANGDGFKTKFDMNSKCDDSDQECTDKINTSCTCKREKGLGTNGKGYYRIHAGKKNENNYYGDYSYDCGEQYGNGKNGTGWKIVLNGTTYIYRDENDRYNPQKFLEYFVDICNFDFRPDNNYPDNPLTATHAQIGPYPSRILQGEEYYYIPGRREERASFPIPGHREKVLLRQELMFRPAYGCEVHEIYLGKKEKRMKKKATLTSKKNVYKGDFKVGKTYYWRVDCTENHDGKRVEGKVWRFTVKEENADEGKHPCITP